MIFMKRPLLHCNNIIVVNIAKDPESHHLTKYIKIDVHFIFEQVARNVIFLVHIPNQD